MPSRLPAGTASEVVTDLMLCVTGTLFGNPVFSGYITDFNRLGEAQFAEYFAAQASRLSNAALANLVLGNLGITPVSAGINFSPVLSALEIAYEAFPASRGQITLNVARLLSGLEGDQTFGAAAAAWNNSSASAFAYSNDPANTSAVKLSALPSASPSFLLTASSTSVREGEIAIFTLTSIGVAPGSAVVYSIVGTNNAANLPVKAGLVYLDASGSAVIAIPLPANNTAGDSGSLTVALANGAASASVITVDANQAQPQTYTLTPGNDRFIAGGADDTFVAPYIPPPGAGMTLGINDVLDGGPGFDTLNIEVGAAGIAGPATLRGIELVSARFSAAGSSLSLAGASGVTILESKGSTAPATFNNIGDATVALRLSNQAVDTSFGYATGALAGPNDTASVTLNNVTGGTLTLDSGFESVVINSASAPNSLSGVAFAAGGGPAPSQVTVSIRGDQPLSLLGLLGGPVTLPATTKIFETSGYNGQGSGLTVNFGANPPPSIVGGPGNQTFVFTSPAARPVSVQGGTGKETVIYNSTIRPADTLSGGGGTSDLLVTTASSAESYTAPASRIISGFELLALSTPGTAGATLNTASLDPGITSVTLGAGTPTQANAVYAERGAPFDATLNAYNIAGPSGTLAVLLQGRLGGTLNINAAGTATTDMLSLVVAPDTAALNVLNGQSVQDSKYEMLTINTGAVATTGAQTLGTVTIAADTGGTSVLQFSGVNPITVGAITAATIDASGMTGAANFTQTSAAGSSTTSITGTANNDVILGPANSAATLSGGAGNDSIVAGPGNQTLLGGDGNDTLVAGVGRDSLVGGTGADTFIIPANALGATISNSINPALIADFVSGTDQIQLGQTVNQFTGNFSTLAAAVAAVSAAGVPNQAAYVSSENRLYIFSSAAGVPATTDTVVSLVNVPSLTAADLQLGALGTGAALALNAPGANVSTGAFLNATGKTTALDDIISSTAANLVGSAIDGGPGADTLVVTTAPAGAFSLAGGAGGASLNSIEFITLNAGAPNGALTLPGTYGLKLTNASPTAAATVVLGSGLNQGYAGGGSGTATITLGSARQSVSTGTGNDLITSSFAALINSTIAGGAGTDTLTIAGGDTGPSAVTALTLSSAGASGIGAQLTAIETINITQAAADVLTLIPDGNLGLVFAGAFPQTVNGTGQTITLTAVPAQAVNLSGTSNFVVSGQTTGVITSTGTGTLNVTAAAAATSVVSASTTLIDTALLNNTLSFGGAGNFNITGAGTAAIGPITEAASHNSGNLSVNTAGNNPVNLAESAAGTGSVLINIAGTGPVTLLPLPGHSVHKITSSGGTGANFIEPAGLGGAVSFANIHPSQGVIFTAAANTNINLVAVADTITGGPGADSINAGLGADIINTGGGADVITLTANSDTGPVITQSGAAGFQFGAVLPAPNTVFNTASLDKISGLTAGATIVFAATVTANTGAAATPITTTPGITLNGNFPADTNGSIAMVRGTYNDSANTFTVLATGTSTLLAYDDNGTTAAGTIRGIVLVGYVDTGLADTYSAAGVFTVN